MLRPFKHFPHCFFGMRQKEWTNSKFCTHKFCDFFDCLQRLIRKLYSENSDVIRKKYHFETLFPCSIFSDRFRNGNHNFTCFLKILRHEMMQHQRDVPNSFFQFKVRPRIIKNSEDKIRTIELRNMLPENRTKSFEELRIVHVLQWFCHNSM